MAGLGYAIYEDGRRVRRIGLRSQRAMDWARGESRHPWPWICLAGRADQDEGLSSEHGQDRGMERKQNLSRILPGKSLLSSHHSRL